MEINRIIEELIEIQKSINFKNGEIKSLTQQIEDIKNIDNLNVSMSVELSKDSYTKEEIVKAYNQMLAYEGLKDRHGKLVTNVMFDFLDNNHHSQ